jgi:hypothetical protein
MMGERVEQELGEIRNLLRNPTPENIDAANQKLELAASFLISVKESLAAGESCDSSVQKCLGRLPVEMSAIRALMQGPLEFFRGLNAFRAAKFGSYERTGTLKNFELESGKTLIHL